MAQPPDGFTVKSLHCTRNDVYGTFDCAYPLPLNYRTPQYLRSGYAFDVFMPFSHFAGLQEMKDSTIIPASWEHGFTLYGVVVTSYSENTKDGQKYGTGTFSADMLKPVGNSPPQPPPNIVYKEHTVRHVDFSYFLIWAAVVMLCAFFAVVFFAKFVHYWNAP